MNQTGSREKKKEKTHKRWRKFGGNPKKEGKISEKEREREQLWSNKKRPTNPKKLTNAQYRPSSCELDWLGKEMEEKISRERGNTEYQI